MQYIFVSTKLYIWVLTIQTTIVSLYMLQILNVTPKGNEKKKKMKKKKKSQNFTERLNFLDYSSHSKSSRA